MHINSQQQQSGSAAAEAQVSVYRLPSAGRAIHKRSFLQSALLTCGSALCTLGLLTLTGCPADLENPERFDQATSTGTGGSPVGAGGGAAVVDTACLTKIFTDQCTVCHFSGSTIGAGLDLKTADFASRLVNVPSMHMSVDPTATCPKGDKLVDTANPTASWLLVKINGGQGNCGSIMPLGGSLTADQKACVTTFVNAEAAAVGAQGSSAGGGGGPPASGSAGAGASTAGTGGT